MATFEWTPVKHRVLMLVFEGKISKSEIAEQVQVSFGTVKKWCREPAFIERLNRLYDGLEDELKGMPYVDKIHRISTLSHLADVAYDRFIEEPMLEERKKSMDGDEIIKRTFNRDAADTVRECFRDIAAEKGERIKRTEIKVDEHVEISAAKDMLLARLNQMRERQQLPAMTVQEVPALATPQREPAYVEGQVREVDNQQEVC